ncbi:DinB/UmuC family translesion DNA polymerase [Streptomyces mirabilis]|uniref:DinB/UmuC family translesion DNA polymerase n=1 Tax=Streptomyces mirabilis TaxID=68239 RepID=UPI0036877284
MGDVADVPAMTLQRLLGARLGRALHERAHARDTAVVDPTPAPASIGAEHAFPRDELDPSQHRRALLALADELGTRLRASDQIAQGLTCTIRYADQTATRHSRTLPEATHHTVLLARTAYALYESLGLQRARVRNIALRADALRPAAKATRQLTLDTADDKPLAIEAVAGRARARFGHGMLYPAALAIGATRGRIWAATCSTSPQAAPHRACGPYATRTRPAPTTRTPKAERTKVTAVTLVPDVSLRDPPRGFRGEGLVHPQVQGHHRRLLVRQRQRVHAFGRKTPSTSSYIRRSWKSHVAALRRRVQT